MLSKRCRNVIWDNHGHLPINRIAAIKMLVREIIIVRLRSTNADNCMLHLGEISIDTTKAVEMANPRIHTKV